MFVACIVHTPEAETGTVILSIEMMTECTSIEVESCLEQAKFGWLEMHIRCPGHQKMPLHKPKVEVVHLLLVMINPVILCIILTIYRISFQIMHRKLQ